MVMSAYGPADLKGELLWIFWMFFGNDAIERLWGDLFDLAGNAFNGYSMSPCLWLLAAFWAA